MTAETTSRKAGIYVRISQDREGERWGVQAQEEDCRKLAERLG
jgi:site-specific DNA recombinase